MGKRNRAGKERQALPSRRKRRHRVDARRALVNAISHALTSSRVRSTEGNSERAVASAAARQRAGRPRPQETPTVPEAIQRRFVAARNIYYFPGGGRAFVDRGDQLTTRSENPQVIQSLAAIAHARGWRQLTVTGTERFKKHMWLAARLAGLAVTGYEPDPHTQVQLVRELSRRARRTPPPSSMREPVAAGHSEPNPTAPSPRPTPRSTQGAREWRGRLIDHGPAPYQHQPANDMSYFIKLQTREGEQHIWGVDLKRALRESLSRAARGDEVVLRRVGQDDVTVHAAALNENGEISQKPRKSRRNRYVIEKGDFLDERAKLASVLRDASVAPLAAAQRHPELSGTYLQLRAAQLAAHRLTAPEDQRRFVYLVRDAIADSIARGEPLRTIGLRTRSGARDTRLERSPQATDLLRG